MAICKRMRNKTQAVKKLYIAFLRRSRKVLILNAVIFIAAASLLCSCATNSVSSAKLKLTYAHSVSDSTSYYTSGNYSTKSNLQSKSSAAGKPSSDAGSSSKKGKSDISSAASKESPSKSSSGDLPDTGAPTESSEASYISGDELLSAVNSALETLFKRDYICYNFEDAIDEGGETTKTGSIQFSTDGNEFLTTFYKIAADKISCYYYDGTTLYTIYQAGSEQFFKKSSYSKTNYYRYINLEINEVSKSEIESYKSSVTSGKSGSADFVLNNADDYTSVLDILGYSSVSSYVYSAEVSFTLDNGVMTGCTQVFNINHNGNTCVFTMKKDFYSVKSGYEIETPEHIK